jgi:topoisomerase IA-like protein
MKSGFETLFSGTQYRSLTRLCAQDILAKRNQKPEVRKAQREQAIRAAKEAKKTTSKVTLTLQIAVVP